MRFLHSFHTLGPRSVAAASAAALLLTSAQTSPTQTAPKQTPTTQTPSSTAQDPVTTRENLDEMSRSHGDFRRTVLAELQRVSAKKNQQMDVSSLIITSCNERSMLAGVSVTPRASSDGRPVPPVPEDHPGQEPGKPDDDGRPVDGAKPGIEDVAVRPFQDREALGLVVIAGSFLRVQVREPNATPDIAAEPGERHPLPGEREVAALGFTTLQPGFYNVRHGTRANTLELVGLDDKIALTIPYRPGDLRGNRPVEAGARRDADGKSDGGRDVPKDPDGKGDGLSGKTQPQRPIERDQTLGQAEQWPEIYMELLHAFDLHSMQ